MSSARRLSRGSAPTPPAPVSSGAHDIIGELEARLTLDEGDDFSFIEPPSVVSSLEVLSARGTRPRGTFELSVGMWTT